MWQKCPVCNGSGKTYNTTLSSTYSICTTCNGTKIISEITGLPPNIPVVNNLTPITEKVNIYRQDRSDDPYYIDKKVMYGSFKR